MLLLTQAPMLVFIKFPVAPIYGGTKYGVIGFSRSSSIEPRMVENHVRINVVCPNVTQTGMIENCMQTIPYPEIMMEKVKTMPIMTVEEVVQEYLRIIVDYCINGTVILLEKEESVFYEN